MSLPESTAQRSPAPLNCARQSAARFLPEDGPLPPTFPPVSEQHPEDWRTAFKGTLHDALIVASLQPAAIDAISVAAQCHGLVAMDRDGSPLQPVKRWNDTTSAPLAAAVLAGSEMTAIRNAWTPAVVDAAHHAQSLPSTSPPATRLSQRSPYSMGYHLSSPRFNPTH